MIQPVGQKRKDENILVLETGIQGSSHLGFSSLYTCAIVGYITSTCFIKDLSKK